MQNGKVGEEQMNKKILLSLRIYKALNLSDLAKNKLNFYSKVRKGNIVELNLNLTTKNQILKIIKIV